MNSLVDIVALEANLALIVNEHSNLANLKHGDLEIGEENVLVCEGKHGAASGVVLEKGLVGRQQALALLEIVVVATVELGVRHAVELHLGLHLAPGHRALGLELVQVVGRENGVRGVAMDAAVDVHAG